VKWLAAAKWLVGVAGFGLLAVGAINVISTTGDSAAVPVVIAGALP
jgi:predicted exporter